MGQAQASVAQMQAYIKKVNPKVADSVIKMIPLYLTEGAIEGVRGDIAFAQSCLETGNFTFSGSAVTLKQNNFCGMGVTRNGVKGNSFKTPAEGIRAQIQHLQAYASNARLKQTVVDPRYTYVTRGCTEYVEYLGIQENPQHYGWAAGKDYGKKIIAILNSILSVTSEQEVTEKENTMNINTSLISNNNSYAGQTPKYIVIHNTDNYSKGANAKAHAKAQHDGNFKGYSAHVFVDDAEAYQALPYDRGAWHVGVNYGGRLFGTVNNHNSIEMGVQSGYNYEKAFQNTVAVCKQIMKRFNIPAERVLQHYDVCAKNCPSAIRAKGAWNRFKQLIGAETTAVTVDKYYRTLKSYAAPVDFISEEKDFSQYPVMIVPAYQLADKKLVARWKKYVEEGGNLVLTCRTAQKDRFGRLPEAPFGSMIDELTGNHIEFYDLLLSQDPGQVKMDGKVYTWNTWGEILQPGTSNEVWATYTNEFYEGKPAVTFRKLGKGSVTYIGVDSSDGALERQVLDKLYSRLQIEVMNLPYGVTMEYRNGLGIVLNYSDQPYQFALPQGAKVLIGTPNIATAGVLVFKF